MLKKDLFKQRIAPRVSHDEIDDAIQQYLDSGGAIKKFVSPSKVIREKPSKGAIFLTSREERYSAD